MSAVRQHTLRLGALSCGVTVSRKYWVDILGFLYSLTLTLLTYGVILEGAGAVAVVPAVTLGIVGMLMLHRHQFDNFYIHIGDKVRIGGDMYDPKRLEENDNQNGKTDGGE